MGLLETTAEIFGYNFTDAKIFDFRLRLTEHTAPVEESLYAVASFVFTHF